MDSRELGRAGEDLLYAQGGELWRGDVDDIRVLDRPFLPRHDFLHEVHGHCLVGRQVLMAVHGQQLNELSERLEKVRYIVNLLLAFVFGGQGLGSHLRVAVTLLLFSHDDVTLSFNNYYD